MQLTHLSLTEFRNFSRLDVDVPGGSVLFVGHNAQGKTSLLESIYYLAVFSSFQASHDRQLVNFLAEPKPVAVAKIIAQFTRSTPSPESRQAYHTNRLSGFNLKGSHNLEVRIILQPNQDRYKPRVRKEILLDGVKRKTSEAIGAFNAVLFLPHMMRIVEGPPEERRRYLNLLMVQTIPHYARVLTDYNRSLVQRNALLKQLAERGGDKNQLDYWDEQLASSGAQIIFQRIHTVQALERLASNVHNELTRSKEVLRLDYTPSFDPIPNKPGQYNLPLDAPVDRTWLTLENIQMGFVERLEKLRNEEIIRGVTTIGPHRDEIRLLSNGIDLGNFGSRGQGRTAVMALKLAEVSWMKESSGEWPVLLLDEVLAELDPERRNDLLSRLSNFEQVMTTTTDLNAFTPEFIASTTIWHIHDGQLSEG